ncbi:MAG: hypothetical protein C0506_16840 [Anaerolinea sp.]|nr:hypothetical protein [Anaerolinea sp.]
MIRTLQDVLDRVVDTISFHLTTYVPPLLVALIVLALFWLVAKLVRWLMTKAIKGAGIDRFLSDSGLRSMFDSAGRLHGTPLIAGAAYWLIIAGGVLAALNVFGTDLTSRMVEATVFLFPKAVTAGLILLAGAWLAQFLGRSVLVWASNEEIPGPRRMAAATRLVTMFVAVVVASDVLDFAPRVFFAAFVILVGGAVLAASLAVGLGGRDAIRGYLGERRSKQEEDEKSLWSHL